MIAVTIPDGVTPGELFQISCSVTCPEGASPGDTIHISTPAVIDILEDVQPDIPNKSESVENETTQLGSTSGGTSTNINNENVVNEGHPASNADIVEEARTSFLQPLLIVGTVAVFTGTALVLGTSWDNLSILQHICIVIGLTALIGGIGLGLEAAEYRQGAAAFSVLFTQLFWVVGGLVLEIRGSLGSSLGWAFVGAIVLCISAVVGRTKGPRVMLNIFAGLAAAFASVALYISIDFWGEVCVLAFYTVLFRGILAVADSDLENQKYLFGSATALKQSYTKPILEILTFLFMCLTILRALFKIKFQGLLPAIVLFIAVAVTRLWGHNRNSKLLALISLIGGGIISFALAIGWHDDGNGLWPALVIPIVAAGEVLLSKISTKNVYNKVVATATSDPNQPTRTNEDIESGTEGETAANANLNDESRIPYFTFLGNPVVLDFTSTIGSASIWLVGYRFVEIIGHTAGNNMAIVGGLAWLSGVALTCWLRWDNSNMKALLTGTTAAGHLLITAFILENAFLDDVLQYISLYFFGVQVVLLTLSQGVFRHRSLSSLKYSHLIVATLAGIRSTYTALLVLSEFRFRIKYAIFGALFAYVPSFLAVIGLMLPTLLKTRASDNSDETNISTARKLQQKLPFAALALLLALPGIELFIYDSKPILLGSAVLGLLMTGAPLLQQILRGGGCVCFTNFGSSCKALQSLLYLEGSALLILTVVVACIKGVYLSLYDSLFWVIIVTGVSSISFVIGIAAVNKSIGMTTAGVDSSDDGVGGGHEPNRTLLKYGLRMQLLASIMFLGPAFIWSLTRFHDYGHIILLMLGGGSLLFLGVSHRHRDVVFLCTVVLVLAFWIQFFVKLHMYGVPLEVPLIVFGVVLLAFAIFYERNLKHMVNDLRNWHGVLGRGVVGSGEQVTVTIQVSEERRQEPEA